MVCSKCGCPLTEGFSRFCPECGTPVENSNKTVSQLLFRIITGAMVFLTIAWIFFPIIRAGGKEITTLSIWDLIAGKSNFDGTDISGTWYLALLFIIPQLLCLIPVLCKKLSIHKIYSIVGIFQLYHAILLICVWVLAINISSFMNGMYGYGYGIIVYLAGTLLTAFLCISFSASQESNIGSRLECWVTTVSCFNLIIFAVSALLLIAGFIFTNIFREIWVCTFLILLSLISGILAYYKMMKKDYSQWLLFPIHTLITIGAHVSLYFYSHSLLDNFVGENDFLDISGFVAPYINTIVVAIAVFAFVYNTAFSVWAHKMLKRRFRH